MSALVNVQGARAIRLRFTQDKKKPDEVTPDPWSVQIDNNAPIVTTELLIDLAHVRGVERLVLVSPAFGADWSAALTITNAAAEVESG